MTALAVLENGECGVGMKVWVKHACPSMEFPKWLRSMTNLFGQDDLLRETRGKTRETGAPALPVERETSS